MIKATPSSTEFVYADELKRYFDVCGHFYTLDLQDQSFECRSLVEIARYQGNTTRINALFVLMNPGSSRPVTHQSNALTNDICENTRLSPDDLFDQPLSSRRLVRVAPDSAQYQLMRVMCLLGWNRIRLVNLSDLCLGNSAAFPGMHARLERLAPDHPECLTHPARQLELDQHIMDCERVIVAWGQQRVLTDQAQLMLMRVRHAIGVEMQFPWFRFASPYRKEHKLQWLHGITKRIRETYC